MKKIIAVVLALVLALSVSLSLSATVLDKKNASETPALTQLSGEGGLDLSSRPHPAHRLCWPFLKKEATTYIIGWETGSHPSALSLPWIP